MSFSAVLYLLTWGHTDLVLAGELQGSARLHPSSALALQLQGDTIFLPWFYVDSEAPNSSPSPSMASNFLTELSSQPPSEQVSY